MSIVFELEIYSPRREYNEKCEIELTQKFMKISMGVNKSKATCDELCDPVWSLQSIDEMMRNNGIYSPAITQNLFEYAWKAWRNGDLDDAEVKAELAKVTEWVNEVSRLKPQTSFWEGYF
jgi:hypothetical protein